MEITHAQLALLTGGEIVAGGQGVVTGFSALRDAGHGDLSFLGNERYLADFRATKAGAILVPTGFRETANGATLIAVPNPSMAFAKVMQKFAPPPRALVPGVHPTAVVDPSAKIDPCKVCIGPHAVVEQDVEIGPGTEIGAGSFIGQGARIGADCRVFPRVSIMSGCKIGSRVTLHSGVVIGSDGFGYELVDGRHQKIDQIGDVVIHDDVDIGANSTVDRARFGSTIIGQGTKIDNQVQIAHNVRIGRHCIIVAQAGIAGSTELGDYVIIAAKAGITGHISIASNCVVAAMSGVTKSLNEPGQYLGFPAMPAAKMRRLIVAQRKLDEIMDRVAALEKQRTAENSTVLP